MKTFIQTLRSLFISPEFLFILLGLGSFLYFPTMYEFLCSKLDSTNDLLKTACLIPITASGLSIKDREIFYPEEDKVGDLQKWSNFKCLQSVYYVGLFFCIFSSATSIITVLFIGLIKPLGMMLIILTVLISCTSYFSIFLARNKIKDLLREAKPLIDVGS